MDSAQEDILNKLDENQERALKMIDNQYGYLPTPTIYTLMHTSRIEDLTIS